MKTILTRLFVHIDGISYPASTWFSKSTTTEKKNSEGKRKTAQTPSPESYNVRGRLTKKSNTNRRTMAP